MAHKIALIGASAQQVPLIVKAKEREYETHTFAWHDGEDLGRNTSDHFYPISATNKEEILRKCREIGVSAVASIGSDISAQAAAYVTDALGLPGNSFSTVTCATNKILTRKRFAEAGIPQPAYVEIGDAVPFESLKNMRYPLIVKPSDRSGARAVQVIEDEKDFFGAINRARDLSFERKAVVEEYIRGRSYSCECLSIGGRHKIIGYTKRDTALVGGRPCEYKHTQPAVIPRSVLKKLGDEIPKALDSLGITCGASSVEFVLDDGGNAYFIEISPYMYGDCIGSALVPSAYGVDLTGAVLDIALGLETAVEPEERAVIASVEFEYSPIDGSRGKTSFAETPVKEFGGYPSLRIEPRKSYYSDGGNTVSLNSEYTALWYALKTMSPARIHIPYYSFPAWKRIAEEMEIDVAQYHVGEDFMPTDLEANDRDAVLLVNFHGMCADKIKAIPVKNKIIDNSTSFFQEPILEDGAYNIYSCRKFFAVSDGAYLISSSLSDKKRMELERDVSYGRAATLLKSSELGSSAAYKDSQTAEQELAKKRCRMSALTEKMLSAVDYEAERRSREKNFAILNESLKKFNLIQIDVKPTAAPQYYPLLLNDNIRDFLLSKKVFVPLMWRNTLAHEFEGTFEKTLSERLVCLPISPEYSSEDMEYLAETVKALIT